MSRIIYDSMYLVGKPTSIELGCIRFQAIYQWALHGGADNPDKDYTQPNEYWYRWNARRMVDLGETLVWLDLESWPASETDPVLAERYMQNKLTTIEIMNDEAPGIQWMFYNWSVSNRLIPSQWDTEEARAAWEQHNEQYCLPVLSAQDAIFQDVYLTPWFSDTRWQEIARERMQEALRLVPGKPFYSVLRFRMSHGGFVEDEPWVTPEKMRMALDYLTSLGVDGIMLWSRPSGHYPPGEAPTWDAPEMQALWAVIDEWRTAFDWDELITDTVDDRLVDEPGPTAKEIFSQYELPAGPFEYNADCWADDFDLTGVSLYHTGGNAWSGGTLVSPRHMVFAYHLPVDVGSEFLFVARDGTPVWRTMIAKQRACCLEPPGYPGPQYWDDVMVGYLDADVPESIAHYKVLPVDFADYLTIDLSFPRLPVLFTSRNRKALVYEAVDAGTGVAAFFSTSQPGVGTLRYDYNEDFISGDSGKPMLMVFDEDELVVLNTLLFGAGGVGPFTTLRIDDINDAMAAVDSGGTGYQLTLFDFEGFLDGLLESSSSFSVLSTSSFSSLSTSSSSSLSSFSSPSSSSPSSSSPSSFSRSESSQSQVSSSSSSISSSLSSISTSSVSSSSSSASYNPSVYIPLLGAPGGSR